MVSYDDVPKGTVSDFSGAYYDISVGMMPQVSHKYSWKWMENVAGNTFYIGSIKSSRLIYI